jgi:hypothetical protein
VWSVLKFAARAAAWRPTPDPPLVGWATLVGWTLVLVVVRGAIQYLDAVPSPAFTPYGINALVAWLVLALAVAAFFVRPAVRATFLSAMVALSALIEVVLAAIRLGLALVLPAPAAGVVSSLPPGLGTHGASRWLDLGLPILLSLTPVIAWIGGMFAVIRSVELDARLRLLGKVIALWAALFIAKGLVPQTPVFVAAGFEARDPNWWEYARAAYAVRRERNLDPDVGTARLQDSQAALLQAAFAGLAAQTKRATDVYAIGIAGWSDQDVFVKEVDGAFAVLEQSLPTKDRMLRLVNNFGTIATRPLASRRNFAAAVHAVAEVMDKDEDVLILFMTSHGSAGGVALQLPRWPLGGADRARGEDRARRRGHQEPRGDRVGLLRRRIRRAVGERPYDRVDRRRCAPHLIRLRPGTGLDLFRRCPVQAELAAGNGFQARVRTRPYPDPQLGDDGPPAAVQPAGIFRDDGGGKARPVVQVDGRRISAPDTVVMPSPGNRHACGAPAGPERRKLAVAQGGVRCGLPATRGKIRAEFCHSTMRMPHARHRKM